MATLGRGATHEAGGGRGFTIVVYAMQFFFGGWFLVHGLNHWLEFFPRPSGSSPISHELIAALNHSGLLSVVKIIEIITGVLLLANRFVPLAVVAAFPVALSIAHLNLVANHDLTSMIVGVVIMPLLCLIALGHLDKFVPMLVMNNGDPSDLGLKRLFGKNN
jgi:uncharacterized membrane protein YphA (DoxX/SURF4 family)